MLTLGLLGLLLSLLGLRGLGSLVGDRLDRSGLGLDLVVGHGTSWK